MMEKISIIDNEQNISIPYKNAYRIIYLRTVRDIAKKLESIPLNKNDIPFDDILYMLDNKNFTDNDKIMILIASIEYEIFSLEQKKLLQDKLNVLLNKNKLESYIFKSILITIKKYWYKFRCYDILIIILFVILIFSYFISMAMLNPDMCEPTSDEESNTSSSPSNKRKAQSDLDEQDNKRFKQDSTSSTLGEPKAEDSLDKGNNKNPRLSSSPKAETDDSVEVITESEDWDYSEQGSPKKSNPTVSTFLLDGVGEPYASESPSEPEDPEALKTSLQGKSKEQLCGMLDESQAESDSFADGLEQARETLRGIENLKNEHIDNGSLLNQKKRFDDFIAGCRDNYPDFPLKNTNKDSLSTNLNKLEWPKGIRVF